MKNDNSGENTSIRLFILMIVIIAVLFGLYMLMANIMESTIMEGARTPEEQEQELAAEKELFPKLDALYDAGDYEGMTALANKPEWDKIDIWKYGHYDLLNYYGQYIMIRDDLLPILENGTIDQNSARMLTESVFSYYYRCYDNTMGAAGTATEKDLAILDGIRDGFILDIIHNRMGFTDEDMEAARGDIMESNYFHTAEADKISDRYSDRYK